MSRRPFRHVLSYAAASLALSVAVGALPAAPAAGAAEVTATANGHALPAEYVVSTEPGVHPEGIAIHHDGTMYVSSDSTGRLYRGDVRTSTLAPFAAAGTTERGTSLGVHTDDVGRVWSVGGSQLLVHDRDGGLVAARTAAGGPLAPSRLNDLVLTPTAVYVTDWANPVVYRASVEGDAIGELEPWLDIRPALSWFPAQYWLLNGIVADPAGRVLLVASNGTEAVWRVDTLTRHVEMVDLGGQSFGADGMQVRGDTLYAVLNYGAPSGVYIARLDRGWRSGAVEHVVLADGHGKAFALPTTLAVFQCRVYVVNSQLDDPVGVPPFTVSTVEDPTCGSGGDEPGQAVSGATG
ncbi:superoxide dismutase [Intrasporangium oryzae NRRL B-24470]|uniref:Superoxide dismutase n=1 Tax=Intrasporangium oryzae NRRL B-24470 TaxID=1386089 RepID=W9GB14_9MICO|nr:hypothetical protein [Intrasporangium oryzae]EWT01993.1 superoxide dismutase [Intrasporangium oryzae NRRL B-24470]